ncbi:MAG TPA: hypothetical protein VFB22_12930 [Candidatus Baltobacteraceae bacterium]|nr:hypothetical protein [Candidatus Baltobacteraceae bacterium]
MARSLIVFALAAAFGAGACGCSSGPGGTSLPFTQTPNGGGGTSGTSQPGGTSTALLRFVQGSPDRASVDFCVDQTFYGVTATGQQASVAYGTASPLFAVPGGISHTVSAYAALSVAEGGPGAECATAPGPYFGQPALATTTIAPNVGANPARETIVLGGTAASGTEAFYLYGEPSFATAPASDEAISHDAAPAFSASTPARSVGFGDVPATTAAPQTLPGAQSVPAPQRAQTTVAVVNVAVTSAIPAPPASFFAGAGTTSGAVVPLTSTPAPAPTPGQPYVIELYALDGPGGGLKLLAVQEQVAGYGF